ncbi:MAG TPA: hypothetical protein VE262_07010 [Blastocatellia bacterium]|nr:hypothetical protein [Blastocatellia bacterium]
MTTLLNKTPKKFLLAGCVVFLLLALTFALSVRTNSQHLQALNQKANNDALERIEKSADHSLRVVGNDDSPFRIVGVKVKEVSGSRFTKLTGSKTDLERVSSVPEVELVNTSDKTITGFVLAIRAPHSRITRTLAQRKVSIAPGETYVVKREHFVNPEKVTVADGNGEVRQTFIQPKMDSERYWLHFAGRSDIFITVGSVSFDGGSGWRIKEGGEIR